MAELEHIAKTIQRVFKNLMRQGVAKDAGLEVDSCKPSPPNLGRKMNGLEFVMWSRECTIEKAREVLRLKADGSEDWTVTPPYTPVRLVKNGEKDVS